MRCKSPVKATRTDTKRSEACGGVSSVPLNACELAGVMANVRKSGRSRFSTSERRRGGFWPSIRAMRREANSGEAAAKYNAGNSRTCQPTSSETEPTFRSRRAKGHNTRRGHTTMSHNSHRLDTKRHWTQGKGGTNTATQQHNSVQDSAGSNVAN